MMSLVIPPPTATVKPSTQAPKISIFLRIPVIAPETANAAAPINSKIKMKTSIVKYSFRAFRSFGAFCGFCAIRARVLSILLYRLFFLFASGKCEENAFFAQNRAFRKNGYHTEGLRCAILKNNAVKWTIGG